MNDRKKVEGLTDKPWYAPLVRWWDKKNSPDVSRSKVDEARKTTSSRANHKHNIPRRLQDHRVSIVSLALSLLLLSTYFVVYWPQYRELRDQEEKIASISKLSAELAAKKEQLQKQTVALEAEEKQYQYLLSSFFTPKELDRLFGNISLWAEDHRLQIERIEKPNDASSNLKNGGASKGKNIRPIHIDVELSGRFFDYLALRDEILSVEKALSIFKEEITVTSAGKVSVIFVMEI